MGKNLAKHLERTFQLWNIQHPTWRTRILRSLIFVTSLLAIVLWPVNSLQSNFLILFLFWILLALTDKPVNRWFLMFNMEFNLAWLFHAINFLLNWLK